MARKRSARNPENPNTVLVVFMVFFILLTIGLGVGTYYGYSGQKKLEEDANSARKEAKASRNAMDYYKFQALTARGAMGPLVKDDNLDEPNDWAVAMEEFDSGTKFKEEKTRPALEQLVTTMKKELGWNAGEKKFATTWADKVKKQEAELKRLQADVATVMAEKKATDEKLRGLQTKYEKDWESAKGSIEKGNQETLKAAQQRTAEMDAALVQNKKQQDTIESLQNTIQKLTREDANKVAKLQAEVNGLTTRNGTLKKQLAEQSAAIAQVSSSLMVGDFAGEWTGTLPKGGTVKLDIKANGTTVWTAPGVAREEETGVSHLEKAGDSYVVTVLNQPVRLFLSNDRRTLRLAGETLNCTLSRK